MHHEEERTRKFGLAIAILIFALLIGITIFFAYRIKTEEEARRNAYITAKCDSTVSVLKTKNPDTPFL